MSFNSFPSNYWIIGLKSHYIPTNMWYKSVEIIQEITDKYYSGVSATGTYFYLTAENILLPPDTKGCSIYTDFPSRTNGPLASWHSSLKKLWKLQSYSFPGVWVLWTGFLRGLLCILSLVMPFVFICSCWSVVSCRPIVCFSLHRVIVWAGSLLSCTGKR